jgi:hypothetical protein
VAPKRKQLRLPWRVQITAAITALLGAVAVTACGGSGDRAARATFSAALGGRFASQAERVATLLDDDDSCAALREARSLRASVDDEIASGRVGSLLREPLRDGVDALTAGIRCVERVQTPSPVSTAVPTATPGPTAGPGSGAEPLTPEHPVEEPNADAEGEGNEDVGAAADEVDDAEDGAQVVDEVEEDNSGPGSGEELGDEESSGSG